MMAVSKLNLSIILILKFLKLEKTNLIILPFRLHCKIINDGSI